MRPVLCRKGLRCLTWKSFFSESELLKYNKYWSVALSITITKCTWVDGIADYNIDYVKVKEKKENNIYHSK